MGSYWLSIQKKEWLMTGVGWGALSGGRGQMTYIFFTYTFLAYNCFEGRRWVRTFCCCCWFFCCCFFVFCFCFCFLFLFCFLFSYIFKIKQNKKHRKTDISCHWLQAQTDWNFRKLWLNDDRVMTLTVNLKLICASFVFLLFIKIHSLLLSPHKN